MAWTGQASERLPISSSKFASVRIDDYNHMIQDLKRLCLTYRDREGKSAPLICLTAAQISRMAPVNVVCRHCHRLCHHGQRHCNGCGQVP